MKKAKRIPTLMGLTLLLMIFLQMNAGFATTWMPLRFPPQTHLVNIPFYAGMTIGPDRCPDSVPLNRLNSTYGRAEIARLKLNGITALVLEIPYFMESLESSEINYEDGAYGVTESRQSLIDLSIFIHSAGIHVIFKPMIIISSGQSLYSINPNQDWLLSYEKFLNYTASLATDMNASIFMINGPIDAIERDELLMRRLVSNIRQLYDGYITYTASHSSFSLIRWWDAMDLIAINAWMPFTTSYNPKIDDFITTWDGLYPQLLQAYNKWKKPIVFSELGLQSREGANISPKNMTFSKSGEVKFSWVEQSKYYRAINQTKIWSAPWFKGTFFVGWDLAQGNLLLQEDTSFSIRDKPAELDLKMLYSKLPEPRDYYPSLYLLPRNVAIILAVWGALWFIAIPLRMRITDVDIEGSIEMTSKKQENNEERKEESK
jgi:hypothetical protein